MIIVSEDVLT